MKLVQITVTADGRVEMSTYGFPGKSCVEATKFMKELLEDDKIFGVNLFEAGLADRVLGYFLELIAGKGAVRATLKKYVH